MCAGGEVQEGGTDDLWETESCVLMSAGGGERLRSDSECVCVCVSVCRCECAANKSAAGRTFLYTLEREQLTFSRE